MLYKSFILAAALSLICFQSVGAQGQDTKSTKEFSGIYPHLAMSNNEGECGTGVVVPWAGYLWVTTYGPHCVKESSDKLYRISEALEQTVMPESVGGTHADRLIHKPTNNLIIGCYIVYSKGKIRVIPRDEMPGRITGAAHAITSPESRVAFATMEEGLYEVDINNLEVKEIIRDGNSAAAPKGSNSGAKNSKLHGYHGKGFYKGFGKYFYANNGVLHPDVATNPTLPSGALAEYTEGNADWTPVRICQFTEISGPGGIEGSSTPDAPIWALGFDAKSLLLGLREESGWTYFRLPKSSHSYDGSHGWNTEWPRIREIGEPDFLMTMHGAFWRFPPQFNSDNIFGIKMRSNYLKVIGDFCRWRDKIVLGCDDSAENEFYNTREYKNTMLAPAQSNSNLRFISPEDLDKLGPCIGRGSVFLREDVPAGTISDPMFVGGFSNKIIVLSRTPSDTPAKAEIEVISPKRKAKIPVSIDGSRAFFEISDTDAEWVRIKVGENPIKDFSANFMLSDNDYRDTSPSKIFDGLAVPGKGESSAALLWSPSAETLAALAFTSDGKTTKKLGTYILDKNMRLAKSGNQDLEARLGKTSQPLANISYLKDSIRIVENGKAFRLPISSDFIRENPFGVPRIVREVSTERDLMNCGGIFYELPAKNAGGLSKARALARCPYAVFDYCSFRGMMIISGISKDAPMRKNPHIIISEDGEFALWAGAIDDVWKLGKPQAKGSPWFDEPVVKDQISEPIIMSGFDKKRIEVKSSNPVKIAVEIDVDGTGLWVEDRIVEVEPDKTFTMDMRRGNIAYWLRFRAMGESGSITATLICE